MLLSELDDLLFEICSLLEARPLDEVANCERRHSLLRLYTIHEVIERSLWLFDGHRIFKVR